MAPRVEHPRPEHHLLYRVVRPDGAIRWIEGHGRLCCDDTGRPLRLVGVSTDVTARKELERFVPLLDT